MSEKTASGLSKTALNAGKLSVVDQSVAAYWSPIVRRHIASSVEGIVATGRVLIDAKTACEHGEFGKLFDSEDSQYVGVGVRSGQMFMSIASHPALSNAKHVSHLPPSWGTLYELSKFEADQIEVWLAEGRITPELQRRDLRQLGNGQGPPTSPSPLPQGTFDVLLADPPWRYDFAESDSRKVENQYATMDVEDIAALEVPVADDAVLFLWATAPKLREALEVMDAWGFEYRTHMIWLKDKIGMGYYARSKHELLLIGRRGDPGVPAESERPDSVFEGLRTEHSRKPQVAYDLIETMYPDRTYCELFARNERDGWTSWGNEL